MDQKGNSMKKSVTFSEDKNKVHLLVAWDFAYRNARKSDWEKNYLNRLRFKRRIEECEALLSKLFTKTSK